MMKQINIAFETLSDPLKRKNYDEWLSANDDEHVESEKDDEKSKQNSSAQNFAKPKYKFISIGKYYWWVVLGILFFAYLVNKSGHIQETSERKDTSNYEECLTDMVKTAKNSDLSAIQNVCRARHPKLLRLSIKKDVKLSCEDKDGKSIYHFNVINGEVKILEAETIKFETTSHSKNGITFKGDSEEKNTKRKVRGYGKIDPVTANGMITVEYLDKKSQDVVYEFNCSEDDR